MPLKEEWSALWGAFSFFTRLPLRPLAFSPDRFVLYLPLVGAFLGGVNFLLGKTLLSPYGPEALAFGLLLVQYFLANYFHFDGLLDTLDALAAQGDRRRRLEILKGPEIGALGFLFGFFHLLGQFLALKALLVRGLGPVFFKPLLGRWFILWGLIFGRPAKEEGLGALFFGKRALFRAGLALVPLSLFLFWFYPWETVVLWFLAYGITKFLERVFGGLTGDHLGALCELGEALFLLSLLR
ncbi:adenosylcobinamide-GDP ribazoletransferase [Thermosulfurimonas marina]|uniref:adenosylcobinamide-GDP ribazoletransferase n=1 Tax=Thermosulfurimonas marina TaxID=2047767 RepID=UPI00144A7F20|nr:adenosylcobinamide-GDP ribazoletransferase [Thermosulfurimonas marina]